MSDKKSLFEILPSKQVFILGVILALSVFFAIGFFVLLFWFVL